MFKKVFYTFKKAQIETILFIRVVADCGKKSLICDQYYKNITIVNDNCK